MNLERCGITYGGRGCWNECVLCQRGRSDSTGGLFQEKVMGHVLILRDERLQIFSCVIQLVDRPCRALVQHSVVACKLSHLMLWPTATIRFP